MVNEIIYSVSEFGAKIKNILMNNKEMCNFFIEGEMSNVTYYKSGHLYFNLKDDKAQLKCAAFNYRLKRISSDLKEGDLIKIFGDVNFYEPRGDVTIAVRHVEKKNKLGELYAKLEKLKQEMAKKGYFDLAHKKQLPKYPKNIGVVTSITGAAIEDIKKTIKKRDNTINIYIYPAKVQGVGAADEIVGGIKKLNEIKEIDLIIAGRGGGSIEDLWAFNEEKVAIAFYNSKKPIISAVGHEIDYMLSDMTADARAATPTQAIEMSVPERLKTYEELNMKKRYLENVICNYFKQLKEKLESRKNNFYLKNFDKIIDNYRRQIVEKEKLLNNKIKYRLLEFRNSLEIKINKLIVINPIKLLERGFGIIIKDKKVIKRVKGLEINDEIQVKMVDGSFISKIIKIN